MNVPSLWIIGRLAHSVNSMVPNVSCYTWQLKWVWITSKPYDWISICAYSVAYIILWNHYFFLIIYVSHIKKKCVTHPPMTMVEDKIFKVRQRSCGFREKELSGWLRAGQEDVCVKFIASVQSSIDLIHFLRDPCDLLCPWPHISHSALLQLPL